MQIKPDEITSILKSRIEGLEDGGADLSEVGTVLSVADGISRVHGLDNCMSMELLELPHDVTGLALNLESDNVGAVLFGEWDKIEEGDQVKRTGRLLQVPVGDALLGRIVDPLGRPLDGKGDIDTDETRPAEFKAPGVVHRQPVKEPMQTGIKPIDAMTNVGRGQRELIIGDRQTGKTSICIDTIINNKDKDLKCVYVAVGQRMSTVVEVAQQLDDHGALDNTVIVAAPADEAAPIKFLAPYAGAAIAEHWLYNEQHALAIYDDLTKHAYAYRQFEVGASWTGFTDRPSFADARAVADGLASAYVDDKVDRVEVFYNGYISAVNQEVRHETLLPLQQADVIARTTTTRRTARTGTARTSTSTTAPSGSTSPTPRRSSPGWCRTTWRSRSTGRCSNPPLRSTALE